MDAYCNSFLFCKNTVKNAWNFLVGVGSSAILVKKKIKKKRKKIMQIPDKIGEEEGLNYSV